MANGTKSLAFATISLNEMAGGLEKNIVRLANAMAARGHRVCLITFDRPGAESFYPIDERIEWHKVGNSRPHQGIGFWERVRLIKRCRAAIASLGRFPVVVCFHHGILFRFLLAAPSSRTRVVCSERNSLALYDFIKARKWNANFLLLTFVDRIVVQFPRFADDYPALYRRKIVAIPNPVPLGNQSARPDQRGTDGRFMLLTVARHSHQKNLAVLVNAFAKIALTFPDWDLHILGDGEHQETLHRLICDLGLEPRVFMHGKVTNTEDWYGCAHLFCLPSKWEGFPNALAEALSHGLPSVGFEQCAGVRDLIQSGNNGLLAQGNGDEQSLIAALSELMSDPERRVRMGRAARESVRRFIPAQIFDEWEQLFSDLTGSESADISSEP